MFVYWESMLGETSSQDMKLWFHVQRLQERYISVLDTDRLEEWPELCTEDCAYEVLPTGNANYVRPGAIVRCFGRSMLLHWIASLRKATRLERHKYRHMTSGLEITSVDSDTIETQSNYVVVQTLADGESRIYQIGRYFDRVLHTVDGWRYQRRRAVYDASRVQTLLTAPL